MGFPNTKDGLERQAAKQRAFLSETAEHTDEATLRQRANALWILGEDLFRLERFEEAAFRLDEAASSLWPFEDQRGLAVHARQIQAMTLARLGRDLEALDLLDGLVCKIGIEWTDPDHHDTMALVLGLWVGLLRDRALVDKVEEVADVVLGWDQNNTTPTQRLTIATALNARAWAEMMRSRWPEALIFLEELVQLCSEEDGGKYGESFLRELASGLVARAYALEQSERAEEALADYEEALLRGASSSRDPDMERILDAARAGKLRVGSRFGDGIRKRLSRR